MMSRRSLGKGPSRSGADGVGAVVVVEKHQYHYCCRGRTKTVVEAWRDAQLLADAAAPILTGYERPRDEAGVAFLPGEKGEEERLGEEW